MTISDQTKLRRFLKLAGDRLDGGWVIMGGAVLPLLGVSRRVTLDIDLAAMDEASSKQTLILMDIAESLGEPVDAVNQAGAFFLNKIKGWRKHLVPLHQGRRATLYRPDATLYVLLKINRMSESDLDDCLAMLSFARKTGEPLDAARLKREIRKLLRNSESPERHARLERLLTHFPG